MSAQASGAYDWFFITNAPRLIDWTYCGVPGGIPNRTTIYTSLGVSGQAPSYVQSVTAAQINAAIAACPSGQVVYLNAGTYNLTGQITFGSKAGVTLRGAGPGQTIINSAQQSAIVNDQSGYSSYVSLVSGYTKGSTSVSFASAQPLFVVGNIIQIEQDDDTSFMMSDETAGQHYTTSHRITGNTGTTLSFTPPLPYALEEGRHPRIKYLVTAGPTSLCGVEDLTLNNTGSGEWGITWWQADRCWVKGVEAYNYNYVFFYLALNCVQCEVRRNYAHHATNYPTNGEGYGVYMYGHPSNGSHYGGPSYCRIEDNVFYEMWATVLQTASSANAVLYNYAWKLSGQGSTNQVCAFDSNHNAHGLMTLWEGNVGQQFQADSYWGTTSHQTIFRNWLHGLHPTLPANRKAIDLCRGAYYFNVVGNILGDSSWNPNQYEQAGSNNGVIYRFGYPNIGNDEMTADITWPAYTGGFPDTNVRATILRHGNYDYYNDAVVWDGGIESHSIPDSMFYSSKPAYFEALQWPPIGPEVAGLVTDIPAKARWDAYVISGDTGDLF